MTDLFTPQRRDEILTNLLQLLRADEEIIAVVLLNPAEIDEAADRLAGLRLMLVVRNGAVFASTVYKWRQRIQVLYDVVYQYEVKPTPETHDWHAMLENYLSLELRFVRLRAVSQVVAPWRVLFDQTGELDDLLNRLDVGFVGTSQSRLVNQVLSVVWEQVITCVRAIRNEQAWEAMRLLDLIRAHILEIAGITYQIDVRQPHAIDQLPEMFLSRLFHTIPTSTHAEAQRRALRMSITLLYDQLSRLDAAQEHQAVHRQAQLLRRYVDLFA